MPEKTITCLNGEFLAATAAMVPLTDRGYRFGDGVFETIRLERGVPYQWAFHLSRLHHGLAALRITPPAIDWQHFARELIQKNGSTDGFLRLSVSRGSGSTGYMPTGDAPIWAMEWIAASPLPADAYTLWLSSFARIPRACLPVNHKLAHGISNTLALLEARDHAAQDALQLTTTGAVCEAASANIFWIMENTLFTPALDTGCLEGATRAAILRFSPAPVQHVTAGLASLAHADAMFLTNTRLGIWPVRALQPLGHQFDTAHPLIATLQSLLIADRILHSEAHAAAWGVSA